MSQRFLLESLEARLLLSATSFVERLDLTTTADLIQLEYDMPALQVELMQSDGAGSLSHLALGDSQLTGGTGQVLLPVVTTQVVIPYGYQMVDVLIETGEEIFLDGLYTLEEGGILVAADGVTTSSMEWIDRSAGYEVVTLQQRRGVDILVLNLYPVTYSMQAGTLSYFDSLSMSVQLTPGAATSGESHEIIYRFDEIRPLAEQVDNPGALASYEAAEGMSAALLGSLVDPADTYDYVIITNNALATASADYDMADFVAHKESVGYSVAMVTVEDIYANYTGIDQQEQIRNFIIDAYNGWETDFVLLGGDSSVIPLRKLLVPGNAPDLIDSDMYYQGLDGDWNADGDWAYGEYIVDNPDYVSDVYLGRAVFGDVTKMSNWVYKTISYENSIKDPYRYNALMVGEWLGFGGGVTEYSKNSLEQLRTLYFNQDPAFQVDGLYERDQAWDTPEIIAEMNSDTYAIYNHLGHSNGGIVMQTHQDEYDAQLTNEKFFFVYSQGCWPGYMGPGGSVGEHLTTHTRNGAAALMFNSTFGWYYPGWLDGPSHVLNRQFWDALFGEGINQIGAMNADSHEDNLGDIGTWYIQAVIYGTTIFGDPSLEIISFDMTISTAPDLPIAYQGEYYEAQLETRNGVGPYSWSVTAGVLPDGLTLNASTGLISGTPTGLPDETFTVQAIDSFDGAMDTETFNLTVLDQLVLLVTELPDGYATVYYNVGLAVEGGTGPYAWSITAGGLPSGLSLDGGTGLLDGTPTTAGSYVFTVEVSDSGGYQQTVNRQYSMDVTVLAPGIYGQVFNDVNGNGQRDAGEVGLNGVTIEVVDLATGLVVDTGVSAAVDNNGDSVFDPLLESGLYSFTGLPAGHYLVRQLDKTGWTSTTLVNYPGRLFSLRSVGSDLTINENDPDTGLLLNSFPAPQTTMLAAMQGLAVGANSLFFIDSGDPASLPVLYELNLETGAVIDSDAIPDDLPAATMGLAVLNGLVYIQCAMDSEIMVFDPSTDQIVDTLTVGAMLMGSLTAAPDMGLLFGSSFSGDIYAVDPSTGAVVDTFSPGVGSLNGGLAYYNGELIASPQAIDASNLVYRIDPVTGALLGTLELIGTGDVVGLGGETVTPPAYGAYRIRMETGQIVQGKDFGNAVQLLGDVDCSGQVDAIDIDIVLDGFGEAGFIDELADLDADGDVDQADVDVLVRDVLNTEYGDVNLLGQVDTTDLTILATYFGTGDSWSKGDLNGDDVSDTTDLTILATYFGFGIPADTLGAAPLSTVETEPQPVVTVAAAVVETPVEPAAAPVANSPVRPARRVAASADQLVSDGPRVLPWNRPTRLVRPRAGRSMRFRAAAAAKSLSPALNFAAQPVQLIASPTPTTPADSPTHTELDPGLVNILDEVDALP